MPIKVTEAIDADTATVVTLEDKGIPTRLDGRPVYPPATIRKALASVQQPTPEQLQFLEGGERTSNTYSFYLNKSVQTADVDTGTPATTIIRRGQRFKVIHVGDWDDYGWFFAIGAKEK